MELSKIIEIIAYCFPALITGGTVYYVFNLHLKNEINLRSFYIRKKKQKQILPLRLQAYERMTLFLERIDPTKLLLRVAPNSMDKYEYQNLLILHIEQEFEHNLAQQIYISDNCWSVITTVKNTLIQTIRRTNNSEEVESADKLREIILMNLLNNPSPTNVALSVMKKEVFELFG